VSREETLVDVGTLVPPATRFIELDQMLEIMSIDYRRALFNSLSINGFSNEVTNTRKSQTRPVICDKYINVPKDSHLYEDIVYTTNGSHRAMMCNILRVDKIPAILNIWDCGATERKEERFFDSHNMDKVYRKLRRKLNIVNGVLPFDIENVPKRKSWDTWIHDVNAETLKRLS